MTNYRNVVACVLILLSASCATLDQPPGSSRKPAEPEDPAVRLTDAGIASRGFDDPARPAVLPRGRNLALEGAAGYEYDVTFVLEVSESSMQSYLQSPSLTGDRLHQRFAAELTPTRGNWEVTCEQAPRCEATIMMLEGDALQQTVPYELIEIADAPVVPFWVLVRSGDRWEQPRVPVGFVVAAQKATPRLEVPLDNTGIADWGFLNPRSPKVLVSGDEPGAGGEAPAEPTEAFVSGVAGAAGLAAEPGAEEGAEAKRRAARREVAQLAVEQLKAIAGTRISAVSEPASRAATSFERCATSGDARVCSTATTTCPDPPTESEAAPTTTYVLSRVVHLICKTTNEALDSMSSGAAEAVTAATAKVALDTIAAAGKIHALARASNDWVDRGESHAEAVELIGNLAKARDDAKAQITDLTDAMQESAELESVVESTLLPAATERASQIITAIADRARVRAEQNRAQVDRVLRRQNRVRFANQTVDRHFVVTFKADAESLRRDARARGDEPEIREQEDEPELATILAEIEEDYGRAIQLTPADGEVTVSFMVAPLSSVDVDQWLLSLARGPVVPFSVDFFDQTDDPAYSQGYIALRPVKVSDQPENKFGANVVAGFTAQHSPCVGDAIACKPEIIDLDRPYTGDMKRQYEATGQLDVTQSLGNRANGKVSLAYETDRFGNAPASVTAKQYQINVFGSNEAILSYGRFTFAQPANKIAISESGEGLRVTFRNFALSYILRRESDDGLADDHDRDHDTWLLQRTRTIRQSRFLRRLDLLALHGEDRCDPVDPSARIGDGDCPVEEGVAISFPRRYWSAGGELFFSLPFAAEGGPGSWPPLSGSFATYYSVRNSRQGDRPDGRGWAALLKVGRPYGFVEDGKLKVKPSGVLTGILGYGTGDDPQTARDEGYLGENASFTQDALFISSLAGAIDRGVLDSSLGRVGKGLSNKWFFGTQYTYSKNSLLGLIAEMFRIKEEDIVGQSTTLSLQNYRFHNRVFGRRDGGWEADLEFRLEQPKDVKWKMSAGYYDPGDALRELVRERTWTFSFGVVLEPARLSF